MDFDDEFYQLLAALVRDELQQTEPEITVEELPAAS